MPRKTLKSLAPTPAHLREIRMLRVLGDWIYESNLWHINRYSASMAFFVGLFVAFIPLPGQVIIAALLAVRLRCNLPLSVGLVFITNPLTVAPMFYAAYRIGALVMGLPASTIEVELSFDWVFGELQAIWKPLLLGCLICGLFFGSLGYFLMNNFWRWRVGVHWRRRKLMRALKSTQEKLRRPGAGPSREQGAMPATPDSRQRSDT